MWDASLTNMIQKALTNLHLPRSQQYGTDFMEFVECRQKNRFKFSDDKYRLVEHYCILLQNLYNNKVNDK